MFWPSLLDDRRHVGGTGRPLRDATGRSSSSTRPATERVEKLTAPFTFAECATVHRRRPRRSRHRTHPLRRQLLGRHDRRHLRRDVPRPHRQRGADELHGLARRAAAETRVRRAAADGSLLGGIRPPLTRSVLKAFLGPTTFRDPPRRRRVRPRLASRRSTWSRARGRCAAWSRAARSARPAGQCHARPCWSSPAPRTHVRQLPRPRRWPTPSPAPSFVVLDGVAHLAALGEPALVNRWSRTSWRGDRRPATVRRRIARTVECMTRHFRCRRYTCGATPSTRYRSSARSERVSGVRAVVNAFGMQVYLVTRHDDVKAMLSDHEHFSNSRPPGFVCPAHPRCPRRSRPAPGRATCSGLDPPEHQRLRRMLTPGIHHPADQAARAAHHRDRRPSTSTRWKPRARPPTSSSRFALPIPSLVICELLGVPYDDRDDFQKRSGRQLDLSLPIPERMEMQRQGREYMQSLVDRARTNPATTSSACWSANTATS